ncbi:MAG TPA: response regulator, partial [Arenimonas sp.]|nr:response regulator [Arenimonas sp.]
GAYRRVASHGLARRNQPDDYFAAGDGVIGQCARDRQPVLLSPVPDGVAVITAGLGEFKPAELVLYPICHKDEVLAVVELGALRDLTPRQHELLAAASQALGLHLANLRAAEHNLALLEESRRLTADLEQQQQALSDRNLALEELTEELRSQAEELKTQTEELKANQEELRAQQEEMTQKNQALESQGRELELARQVAEARSRELQQASQYKSEFLANMSHELRTPLNSILILAKSLADNAENNLSPDQAESAAVIHESGSHLLALINDILDLSKIEAGRLEIVTEDFPLDDLLGYLRRVFAPQAEKKSLLFAIDVDASAPAVLRADRQRVTQVITNLLSNAIKFTERGEVRLSLTGRDGILQIEVRDTGIGIPPDKLEHVFGVFQQLDGTTSRKYGGSGLGLAISQRLVDLMGGRILASSQPGSGSCFTVQLPLTTAAAATLAPTQAPVTMPSPPRAPRTTGANSGHVLVVEDDERLVKILERLIDTLGFAVTTVDSAEKALASIKASRPQGVLLDLGLPGMTGMEVLKQLKEDRRTARIPVFIMSGAVDTGEAKTLGAMGFLKKPVTREMIAAALDTIRKEAGRASGKSVLVVEDNAATITAIRQLFARDPIALLAAGSGAEALTALEREHVDAVVLDLSLPDMSGFEWLEHLRARGAPHPPVLVYSARELSSAELRSLREYTETIVIKGRHSDERLREEVLTVLDSPPPQAPAKSERSSLSGCRLLLVDDDARNLYALSKALRAQGLAVTVAEDGERALEALRTQAFDVMLTDIMMPGIDGYELIRRARELGHTELPIVAVTAKAMQGDRDLCLQAGADAYIAKPVEVTQLLAQLKELL